MSKYLHTTYQQYFRLLALTLTMSFALFFVLILFALFPSIVSSAYDWEIHVVNDQYCEKEDAPEFEPFAFEVVQPSLPEICYPKEQVHIESYMYHYVRPTWWDAEWSVVWGNSITPEIASDHYQHLSRLQANGSIYLSFFSELEEFYEDDCFPHQRIILLTFDDGRRDNYNFLLPLAREYWVKANLWIIWNRLSWDPEERIDSFMTVGEIKEMLASGYFDLQSHSMTHTNLKLKNRNQQRHEICESTKYLEWIFERKINSFVYPMWLYNWESVQVAHHCWIRFALTTAEWYISSYDLAYSAHELKRIRVRKWISWSELFGE